MYVNLLNLRQKNLYMYKNHVLGIIVKLNEKSKYSFIMEEFKNG